MTLPRTILLVDDDADVRESVGDALTDEGYQVATAANGKEALLLLNEGNLRPDLILLDMMMPQMDGWTFRTHQREQPEIASIPVLVFTAHGSPKGIAEQLQTAGFLNKPIRLDELLAIIRQVRGAT